MGEEAARRAREPETEPSRSERRDFAEMRPPMEANRRGRGLESEAGETGGRGELLGLGERGEREGLVARETSDERDEVAGSKAVGGGDESVEERRGERGEEETAGVEEGEGGAVRGERGGMSRERPQEEMWRRRGWRRRGEGQVARRTMPRQEEEEEEEEDDDDRRDQRASLSCWLLRDPSSASPQIRCTFSKMIAAG